MGASSSRGFVDFDYEITLLTVRAIGARGEIETHFCEPVGHVQVSGDYVESWQPQAMSPVALEKAQEIAVAGDGNLAGAAFSGWNYSCVVIRCGLKSVRDPTIPVW